MLKIFIMLFIINVFINIFNISVMLKCNSYLQKMFFAFLPGIINTMFIGFYMLIEYIKSVDVTAIRYITIVSFLITSIVFYIVNAFCLVASGNNTDNKTDVIIGMLILFALPLVIFLSIPISILSFLLYKFFEFKNNNEIKISEEEIFDIGIPYNEYNE